VHRFVVTRFRTRYVSLIDSQPPAPHTHTPHHTQNRGRAQWRASGRSSVAFSSIKCGYHCFKKSWDMVS
jgi:hypothetical protein